MPMTITIQNKPETWLAAGAALFVAILLIVAFSASGSSGSSGVDPASATTSPTVSRHDAIGECVSVLQSNGVSVIPGTMYASHNEEKDGTPVWEVDGQWENNTGGPWGASCTVSLDTGKVTYISTPFGSATYH